ncbi:SOS-response transcriptional repressor LexA [Streptomyces sp. B3I7]|uniref:LexA family protein n=1 Tax=Streptomyces sp. B3I7 TaxID=3042269 RepID=UPI002785529C|nr:MarR family transcriptional regulator [Streptomyces sp. B3I7]MDQ0809782.1 SOS-response transcriptional repressor LexA [Streptomyces sp. B3I7]
MGIRKVDYPTTRQEAILRHIRAAITDRGEAPTVAEIAAAMGMRPSSIHYQLGELEAKGAIVRVPGQRRGIRLA